MKNSPNQHELFHLVSQLRRPANKRRCQQLGLLKQYEKAAISIRHNMYESVFINLDVRL